MKAKNRMRYCAWCGEELGESDYSDPESCGKIECEDKVRDMYRQELDRIGRRKLMTPRHQTLGSDARTRGGSPALRGVAPRPTTPGGGFGGGCE